MRYPNLRVLEASRQMVDVFKGYNHNLRISDGEFFDMKNMSSDSYPVLSPRGKRGMDHITYSDPAGMIAKDSLCIADKDGSFFINNYAVDMELNEEPKQLISMGAYVIVMPDKKWINTMCWNDDGTFNVEKGWGYIEAEVQTHAPVSFTLCKLDGTDYSTDDIPRDEPAEPENMELWIDTSSEPHSLKMWSESAGMWVSIGTTYVKIASAGIGVPFEKYDGITITGLSGSLHDNVTGDVIENSKDLAALEGAAVVWEKGDDYIVVVGILDITRTITDQITISRKMPVMDFVVESGNRLFGCRYGENADGEVVNEIYASKLGDFKNWSCYMGLSTDSYAASCGTDGAWTGAITHLGYPLFFKENCVHKVYGNYPANFQIQDTACSGVQKGCEKSLAIVNSTLFYKARSGVCAYDGSLPTEISYALGNEAYSEAVGVSHGNKYYISMKDTEGTSHLFVYDVAKGMWHKEDNLQVDQFCSCRGKLYANSNGAIITMLGSDNPDDEPVEWMVQTGEIGVSSPDMKYISRLNIRMSMDIGTEIRIYAQYDFSEAWEAVCTLTSNNLRSFSIPIKPKRCDHLKLRIEGVGNAKIYSITKTIEQGSDRS